MFQVVLDSFKVPVDGAGDLGDISSSPSPQCLQHYLSLMDSPEQRVVSLHQLQNLTKDIMEEANKGDRPMILLAFPSDVVTLIFEMCAKLQVPDNTKYLAIETYARFCYKLVKELEAKPANSSQIAKLSINTELSDMPILRLASSIQLASKFDSYGTHFATRNISTLDVKQICQSYGCHFAPSEILESEVYVFRLLNHRLNTRTPFDVLELILAHTRISKIEYPIIYSACSFVLDYLYRHAREINEIFNEITKEFNQESIPVNGSALNSKLVQGYGAVMTVFFLKKKKNNPCFPVLKRLLENTVDLRHVTNLVMAITKSVQLKKIERSSKKRPFSEINA